MSNRYLDPTGHIRVEGCTEMAGGCDITQRTIDDDLKKSEEFRQTTNANKCKKGNKLHCSGWSNVADDANEAIDWLIWRTVPSALGINVGINAQSGLVMEAGMTPFEVMLLYNWRSGQLTVFQSNGTNGYVGSPTLLGGGVYLGVTTVYGASDNQYMAGESRYGGAGAQADVLGKAGVVKQIGYSANVENGVPYPFVDPVSNAWVTFRQTNVTVGTNLFPDGVDIGFFAGQSYSEIKKNWLLK